MKNAPTSGLVCYCFGHSVQSIREEIERTGRSTAIEAISTRMKKGECACERLNPKGICCLVDVRRVVRELLSETRSSSGEVVVSRNEAVYEGVD